MTSPVAVLPDETKFRLVKKAFRDLSLLPPGATLTMKDLFGLNMDEGHWHRKLMERATEEGLVQRIQHHPRTRVHFSATEKIADYLNDDELLSRFMWSQDRDEVERRLEDMRETGVPEEPENIAENDVGEGAPVDDDPSSEEILTAILKMTHAGLENMADIRMRLTAIEGDIAFLKKEWLR